MDRPADDVDVGFSFDAGATYPAPPFHPPERYPEFDGTSLLAAPTDPANRVYGMVREALFRRLGAFDPATRCVDLAELRRLGSMRRIVVKPNWVRQQEQSIDCVTTHGSVLRPLIDILLLAFGSECEITVADIPLQSADLDTIWAETGVDALREHYDAAGRRVRFLDWRREKAVVGPSGFITGRIALPGDPDGYVDIELGEGSFLEEVTTPQSVFSVNDYEPGSVGCRHHKGEHGFLFPKSALAADLLVNVPKLKTHCKAGLTASMKNLVGLNGDKGWIPHFRAGAPADGGDEYPDDARHLMRLKSRFRDAVQGRHEWAYRLGQALWSRYRRRYERSSGRHLLSGGAWPGNDTLWRSILDLVVAITFADADGRLQAAPQRRHLCLVDAIVCGEKEGPLNPTPRPVGMILCALDPVSADWSASRLASFDWRRVPQFEQARRLHALWAGFPATPDGLAFSGSIAGRDIRSPADFPAVRLAPAAGWEGIADAATSGGALATAGSREAARP